MFKLDDLSIMLAVLVGLRFLAAAVFLEFFIRYRENKYALLAFAWLIYMAGPIIGLLSYIQTGNGDPPLFGYFAAIGTLLLMGGVFLYYRTVADRSLLVWGLLIIGVLSFMVGYYPDTGRYLAILSQLLFILATFMIVVFKRKWFMSLGGNSYYWLISIVAISLFHAIGSSFLYVNAAFSLRLFPTLFMNLALIIFFLHFEYNQSLIRIQKSEQRLSRVQEIAQLGWWEWDKQTDEVSWSENIYRIFNLSCDNNINHENIIELIHPEDRQHVDKEFIKAVDEKEKNIEIRYRAVCPGGELRYILLNVELFYDDSGKIKHMLGAVLDVTELEKAETAAITSQKMANLGVLAAGIAHEINSPLQLITGFSRRLSQDLDDEKVDKELFASYLGRIEKSAWRIVNIIRSLLTYARQSEHVYETHDLNNIVEDTLLLIEHQMQSWANISVEKMLASDLPAIECDGNNITQVIINLLENAKDAMPKGGWIKIKTLYDTLDHKVVLQIFNTGEVIPEEIQAKIFEPFFTTKLPGKGTGLGLSIVLDIVQAHGGDIEMESLPGKGTTFTIKLPLVVKKQSPGLE